MKNCKQRAWHLLQHVVGLFDEDVGEGCHLEFFQGAEPLEEILDLRVLRGLRSHDFRHIVVIVIIDDDPGGFGLWAMNYGDLLML